MYKLQITCPEETVGGFIDSEVNVVSVSALSGSAASLVFPCDGKCHTSSFRYTDEAIFCEAPVPLIH